MNMFKGANNFKDDDFRLLKDELIAGLTISASLPTAEAIATVEFDGASTGSIKGDYDAWRANALYRTKKIIARTHIVSSAGTTSLLVEYVD